MGLSTAQQVRSCQDRGKDPPRGSPCSWKDRRRSSARPLRVPKAQALWPLRGDRSSWREEEPDLESYDLTQNLGILIAQHFFFFFNFIY